MPRPKPVPVPDPLPALIDELGAIEKELAPLRSKIARSEDIRRQLREAHRETAPTRSVEITGEHFIGVVGPMGLQTKIDYPALLRKIRPATYATWARCTLKDLEFNCREEIVSAVTSQAQTGPRQLKVYERGL